MKNLFFSREKIVQTFETLQGLIDGIRADGKIKNEEVIALKSWVKAHNYLEMRRPFNDIINIVKTAVSDHVLSEDEILDIKYVCKKFLDTYGGSKMGHLHGFASGIASDGELNEVEWKSLAKWIHTYDYLRGSWPYDEINALVHKHRSTLDLSSEEKEIIIYYFNDFCGLNKNSSLTHPLNEPNKPITGICAVCPDIEVYERTFCLTGESKKYSRDEITDKIFECGGIYKNDMSNLIDYLVVCSEGSPMWIYSCYGRKVEKAIAMRKAGHPIQIIHEFDLLDALEDAA
ncbi:BRCT domain-containing protein [Bdellovibrio bacteriovorus]|uniref:BRCT domain-containing protein n=1 Tax=Bdellovibrio bacteriovorus TaxID=959 RepID=UPI0035A6C46A